MPSVHVPLTRSQLQDLEAQLSMAERHDSTHYLHHDGPHPHSYSSPRSAGCFREIPAAPSPMLSSSSSSSSHRDSSASLISPSPSSSFVFPMSSSSASSSLFWSATDRAVYLVWWAYRPPFCESCGSEDRWHCSAEQEYRCAHCGQGSGTTAVSDTVEEIAFGGGNDDEDDHDGDPVESAAAASGAGGEGGTADSSALAVALQFLNWLDEMPPELHPILPKGESVPTVLRQAIDLALLFTLPNNPPPAAIAVRGSALYISLIANGMTVPFPLYQRVIEGGVTAGSVTASPSTPTASVLGSLSSTATNALATEGGRGSSRLLWLDVQGMAHRVGMTLSDFFESEQASGAYLLNAMSGLPEFKVPSIMWRLDKGPSHRATTRLTALRNARKTWFSPEHTATFVVMEFSRELEASMQLWSTSPIGTETDIHRLREWVAQFQHDPRLVEVSSALSLSPKANAFMMGLELPPSSVPATCQRKETSSASPSSTECLVEDGLLNILPTSKLANLLLHMIAYKYHHSPLEVADMLLRSGLYQGPCQYLPILRAMATAGVYFATPLCHRLSPLTLSCPWISVYEALHSEDRLPLLTALHLVSSASTREKEQAASKVIQRILRKCGASQRIQLAFSIRCTDATEKHLNGLFGCTFTSPTCAIYTCLRSGRKTIAFHAPTATIAAGYLGSKERVVEKLSLNFIGPVELTLEGLAAKYAIDCARSGLHSTEWNTAAQKLSVCDRIRKTLRNAGSASLALQNIRPMLQEALMACSAEATMLSSGASFAMTVALAERTVQRELLSMPSPSLLYGATDARMLAWYHLLVSLAEHGSPALCQTLNMGGEPQADEEALSTESRRAERFSAWFNCTNPKKRYRLEDAPACAADVVRCLTALSKGMRADLAEAAKSRSARRQRRMSRASIGVTGGGGGDDEDEN